MDEEWEKRGEFEAPDCKRKPSEYLKGDNVFFHTEPSETLIPQVVDILGENALLLRLGLAPLGQRIPREHPAHMGATGPE